MTWYATRERRTVYEGWSSVHVDTVELPDGGSVDREVVEHVPAVAIVPLRADGSVVLLRQYRHPLGRYVLEIPAGVMDPGEQPAETAARELAEEAGLRAGRLDALTTFANSGGWSTERTHVFLGRELEESSRPEKFVPEAEEADMEILLMPLEDALAAVADGTIDDAKTVIGLLLTAHRIHG